MALDKPRRTRPRKPASRIPAIQAPPPLYPFGPPIEDDAVAEHLRRCLLSLKRIEDGLFWRTSPDKEGYHAMYQADIDSYLNGVRETIGQLKACMKVLRPGHLPGEAGNGR